MRNINIENLVRICKGMLTAADANIDKKKEAAGVCIDSRLVEKDYVFIATKGERVDGHDYIASAFETGAMLAVCERIPEGVTGPCIVVKDSLIALKDIAEFYRDGLEIKVVGITGSVGKTSAKEFIASVLSEKYNVLKTEGNFNNEIGLPLTICRIRDEHEVAVLEMGISDFGEMTRLAKMAKPDYAVITNIGQCHLENLKDRDGVLSAKTEIFKYLKKGGLAILNKDDDKLSSIRDVNGEYPVFFGTNKDAEIHPLSVTPKGLLGSEATLSVGDSSVFSVNIPLPGVHRIYNVLAAVAVGTVMGLNEQEIVAGIEKMKATPGRGNVIQTENLTILDDCYNANPVSMKAAIDLLTLADTDKVAILGDMFELGSDEIWLHEGIGKYAVQKEIDVIVCIGTLAKSMYEGAVGEWEKNSDSYLSEIEKQLLDVNIQKRKPLWYFETKEEFLEQIDKIIQKKDAVLVKASHGMHFEELVKTLQEWQ